MTTTKTWKPTEPCRKTTMLQDVAQNYRLVGNSSTNISRAHEIHATQNVQGDV